MGALLGILTAVSWGGADFAARFSTHRIGTLRTLWYVQMTGLVLLSFLLPWFGGWGHLADGSGWQPWLWGMLVGVMNVISTMMLYRSFEIGKLSIVAPISSAYPVVSVLLSVWSGERLSGMRIVGIVCILLGVVVVSRGEQVPADDSNAEQKTGKGISWAIAAAAGFGVLLWLLGMKVVPSVGAAQTVWIIRVMGTLVTPVLILFWGNRFASPTSEAKQERPRLLRRLDKNTALLVLANGVLALRDTFSARITCYTSASCLRLCPHLCAKNLRRACIFTKRSASASFTAIVVPQSKLNHLLKFLSNRPPNHPRSFQHSKRKSLCQKQRLHRCVLRLPNHLLNPIFLL